MGKKGFLTFVCFVFFITVTFAQKVSVNNFTGTPGTTIPLYNIISGQLSLPVAAVYSGNGVQVKDVEGSAGIGWEVAAGGGVYRQLRGLPDDVKKDLLSNPRLGWLYNTNGARSTALR
ncbi:hypothetical protein SNE25_06710 [Mucilaginibacter sabulilitoris]|uniref:Uncharacterized protein n=1 Tax=Mucilaginibacter sabulilitoris TaxID=1173583 RepID=A0ABZ0TQM9_9SPHI|nr:hypothetical protein [Mucilaginibacter sabulilitoris]WPU95214.1 hypothetical protein SNE25_06710 [Mucilaginibacter sabulilitoris]